MESEKYSKTLQFPDNFLWGISTSAYQIEGGNMNDWNEWERGDLRFKNLDLRFKKEKRPLDMEDFICGKACDSYNRWREDIDLIESLNCGAYRFSIEWSRVEPEMGKFDRGAIEHYRDLIRKLKEKNIEPFITLWHWTNPLWISDLGGWQSKKTVRHFLNYVSKMTDEFGHEANFWITLNEPQTYVGLSYVAGIFPPQKKSLFAANKVFKNLMKAHKESYKLIKGKLGAGVKVGLSHYANYHSAYNDTFLNKKLVGLMDYLKWRRFISHAEPFQDFIGFQYYHHDRVKFKLGGRFIIADSVNENKKTNDMGWEIYPEGIYHLLKHLKKYDKPIYITENGTADEDDDHRREFIRDHLKYIHRAIEEGVPVKGYFYWSLLDNFEWAHGFAPKFGLFSVDRLTCERKARSSAAYYADICKNNKIEI
jgi:beta-glucosidase